MFEVRRPFRNGWYAQGSYLYGESKSIMDGTSSQAASNWGNVLRPGRSEQSSAGHRRSYDPGHRDQPVGVVRDSDHQEASRRRCRCTTPASPAGRTRCCTSATSTATAARVTSNDLQYTPASASEVTFTGGTYQDLLNFMQADECLGQYVGKVIPRNACRAPWQNQLDLRLNFGLPFEQGEGGDHARHPELHQPARFVEAACSGMRRSTRSSR